MWHGFVRYLYGSWPKRFLSTVHTYEFLSNSALTRIISSPGPMLSVHEGHLMRPDHQHCPAGPVTGMQTGWC